VGEPEIRKGLAKLQYADAWAQSLRESHADSPARTAMLEDHWREVELLHGAAKKLGIDDVERVACSLREERGALAPWF
jgi:hypothetical protein